VVRVSRRAGILEGVVSIKIRKTRFLPHSNKGENGMTFRKWLVGVLAAIALGGAIWLLGAPAL
jgi:hypothetical protein